MSQLNWPLSELVMSVFKMAEALPRATSSNVFSATKYWARSWKQIS